MVVLYPAAIGSPVPGRPGLGLTVLAGAEGFGSATAFEEALVDLWERLVAIPPFESLDEPAGNCSVYPWHDPADSVPFRVSRDADGALAADPDRLLAVLGGIELAEPSGGDPLAALTDLPWPNDAATAYATTLLVVLVDGGHLAGRGEWLGSTRLDVPYHLVVSTGDGDAAAVAVALGRIAGLADESGATADVPAFARRRSALNALSGSLQQKIDEGTAADPWLPWRAAASFAPASVDVDGVGYHRPEPTLMGAPRTGTIDEELVARAFGATGTWAFGSWS
jgi:hypothetical protein